MKYYSRQQLSRLAGQRDSSNCSTCVQGAADRTGTTNAISARIMDAEAALQLLSASERWAHVCIAYAAAVNKSSTGQPRL